LSFSSKQNTISVNLTAQQIYLGISLFDQASKPSNHSCASLSKSCESLVLICEISTGSGVTCSLGVGGCSRAELLLQACNPHSIDSTATFQSGNLLRVDMSVFLLIGAVLQQVHRLGFYSCLRLLRLSFPLL